MMRIVTVVVFVASLTSVAYAQGERGSYIVFFDLNSAAIGTEGRQAVRAAADDYQSTGAARIEVRGHTDTLGTADYNEELSERRADAVAEELIGLGVPPAAITREGMGETELLISTNDGVREPRNRRAEIELERPSPPPMPEAPPPAAGEEPPPVAAAPVEPVEERPRGLFSLGGLYGFNLLDEGADDDDESHLAGLNLSFDYAVADWVALSLEQAGFYHFSDDEGFGGRSAAGLNFTLGWTDVVPYLGGNIGYIYGSGIDDDWFAGPEVGLKLGPLNAKVAYDIPFGRDLEEGIIFATVGLGIQF